MTKTKNRFGILNFGHCDLFGICDLLFGILVTLVPGGILSQALYIKVSVFKFQLFCFSSLTPET
jgi:hypothetical protein